MNSFLEAIGSIFIIFILIVIGYVLQKKKKINIEIGNFLSFLVVNITLPCSIFKTINSSLDLEKLKELPLFIVIIMLSQILSITAGFFMAKAGKIDQSKKGSFITLTAFNNTLFMGLPINMALFGEQSATVVLYYYVSSTILFWTVGIKIIAGKNANTSFKLPTPVYGIFIGFIMLFITEFFKGFEIPQFVTGTVNYLAGMTTPLAMIFTGYALGEFGIRNIRFSKEISFGLIARFVVAPLIFISIIMMFSTSELQRNVLIVQSFMPVMATQTIVARKYNVDDTYPAVMVTVSTLLSLIIIPIVKAIIT